MRYLFIVSIFFLGCASVQPLSGGSADETPPTVISTSIDSAAININSQTFEFNFDEYIQLKQASEKLLISPNQIKPPTITAKKKKLIIELNDDLIDSTTYTFQFNGAVADINEGNALTNYNFIFSTGTYIDSGSYSGTIIDYVTKEPCDGCNVYLYNEYTDTTLLKIKPEYLTRTNDKGKFQLNNLPNRTFSVISLKDKNNNIYFDKDEEVSLPVSIHIDSLDSDTIYIFPNENTDGYKIDKLKNQKPGTYQYISNRPLVNDSLALLFGNTPVPYDLSFTKDTITTYYAQGKDTLHTTLLYKKDTFQFTHIIQLNKLKYAVKPQVTGSKNSILLKFKTPIKSIDTGNITLITDSILSQYNYAQLDTFTIELIPSKLYKKATILLKANAITDIYNQNNKADTSTYTYIETDPTTLSLDVKGDTNTAYIIYVIQDKTTIDRKYVIGSKKLLYNNLQGGKYKITIYTDTNNNGVWDTGNLFKLTPPEKVTITREFELRPNWDKELIINIKE